jgi:preprotein translocase subunit YajC
MDITSLGVQVLLIAALFVVFYLTLVRPQQNKLRRHKQLVEGLRPGDRISTHGGLVGTIVATDNAHILSLEIAPNVQVAVTRKGIDEVWPASAPLGTSAEATETRTSLA